MISWMSNFIQWLQRAGRLGALRSWGL